jgi:hypothetical protein
MVSSDSGFWCMEGVVPWRVAALDSQRVGLSGMYCGGAQLEAVGDL